MTDLSSTILPKSDQLNADDLITGPRTIRITKVSACPGSAEQPIAVSFEGDNGKPYKPCKSMRRVLVHVWGKDGNAYIGRGLTLYRDPQVQFGGVAVGGIRISHMSHIDAPQTMALTATRASRKPFTVKPLEAQPSDSSDRAKAEAWLKSYLTNPIDSPANQRALAKMQKQYPDLYAQTQLSGGWGEGPADEQMAERDLDRETADRLISDVRGQADSTQLGFMADDLNAYMALPEALQLEVDAAVNARRAELEPTNG